VTTVVAALRSGQVVGVPTDTVYGLAAALDRPDAIARLYGLKSRPSDKAIPVLLSHVTALENVAADIPDLARALMEQFWPGALTVAVPALPTLPDEVTSLADDGTRTVAVRIPNHTLAREILAASGGALAVTSANRSGQPPALDANAVLRLGQATPDVIIDGGPAPLAEPSTVILALGSEITVLREGAISATAIEQAAQRFAQGSSAAPHAV
jgi:L-threonylcarbamoyladenylate synthase